MSARYKVARREALARMRRGDLPTACGTPACMLFDDNGRTTYAVARALVRDGLVERPRHASVHSTFTLTPAGRDGLPAHLETEVQGRGRRYWFRRVSDAVAFESGKQARGYAAVRSGVTVWVPFGKRTTEDVRRQRAGMDPEVW